MEMTQYDVRNRELFAQMDKAIREQQLFTKRNYGRDDVCQMLNIDRNRFSIIIRQYSGAPNFCAYLNKMRMNHAVLLLKKYPNWTLKAIIEACGMTITPFKRAFKETFGMAPNQYRRQLGLQRNAKNTPSGRASTSKRRRETAKEC